MTEQTEQKLLDQARQADELRQLLREVLPILRWAFFANYVQTKAADELYDKIMKTVRDNDAPIIEAEPVKHGRWMYPFYCSECGFEPYYASDMQYNYCPNCGARMDGDSDDQP